MDTTKAIIVVCVTLFIVIVINAAIYVAYRRGNEVGQIELLRRATQTARKPWQTEDDALKKLADEVSKIRQQQNPGDEKTNKDQD